ncbi:AraC-like DNA-binding protein [Algoriphagus sp. 4150]|uniref:helix-turn-helix domain-containing protein n=1 Tax=Algoriphagus sp. 4150 TaxID=2817756 RepID=UPI00285D9521|nr:helix-turn-helix domain-containing protein [Algoriphagus sp. 4150]MDR7128124.1 AraC-like DNA-binding protein [Algoriphagus sp. 4150]
MEQQQLFQKSLKKLGLKSVIPENMQLINSEEFKEFIKILYLPSGYTVTIDFTIHKTIAPSLIFVSPNQFMKIEEVGIAPGYLIFYNRDFYCIQIHDAEVACDGLLFNNIHNMPLVSLPDEEAEFTNYLFAQISGEIELNDSSLEEMIRTYLKQLLIKSTRIWKRQHLEKAVSEQPGDLEFFRNFTLLVDVHFRKKHSVADYADLLSIAPKTITHKFKRLNLPQPNDVIKNRVILEAKRLLVHTGKTAKEIAYELGYDDPAYFSRLFQLKTGESPSGFRLKYHGEAEN